MIVLFGGEKGGTGKSTMAVIQAAWRASQGRDVLLIDADSQRSAQKWATIRTEDKIQPAITCISVYGKTLDDQVRSLRDRYEDIVIDTRGADSTELRAALMVADLLVTPCRPSQFDIFTLATMDRLVHQVSAFNKTLKARLLVNLATTHSQSTDAADLRESCADLENYQVFNTTVKDRKVYRLCARDGLACHEYPKQDEKAVFEMNKLGREIWNQDNE